MGSITSDSLPKTPPAPAGRVRRQVARVTPPVEETPISDPEQVDDQDQIESASDDLSPEELDADSNEESLLEDEEDVPPPPPTRVVHAAGKPVMGRRSRPATAETTTPTAAPSADSPVKTHFRVILKEAATYEYNGMKFKRGVPVNVPIKYYKVFKSNGYFTVVG